MSGNWFCINNTRVRLEFLDVNLYKSANLFVALVVFEQIMDLDAILVECLLF